MFCATCNRDVHSKSPTRAVVGNEIINKVPPTLHTPLMSGSNAISGIVIVGAVILVRQSAQDDYVALGLGFVGIVLGTINVVGGHAVTHRMLEMFKKKK